MHRDSLERWIEDHRESFDDAVPSLKVWAEIDQRVSARRTRRMTVWRGLRVAAAVVALLFTGALAGLYLAGGPEPTVALEAFSPEYAEMARFYESQIDQRVQQLAAYQQGEVVLEDFEQLDATMAELRQELLSAPAGKEEQILENLIRSYQTKVEILERVLDRIQQPAAEDRQLLKPANNEISI